MKNYYYYLCVLALLLTGSTFAQSNIDWLGDRSTNTSLYLDPTEIQCFGSVLGLANQDLKSNQYLPFAFGGAKNIASRQIDSTKSWEIFAEFGVFTQFEWILVNGERQRNLINSDYKAAISYARQISKTYTYRLRFFHVSSHLGDDYILRNSINSYSQNKVNYEQLEFSLFQKLTSSIQLNYGIGAVVRPNAERLPFSFHLGINRDQKLKHSNWGTSIGILLKGFQETAFTPNFKVGVGPAYYGKNEFKAVRLLVEYYQGHIPYSQFEVDRLKWLGVGLYFYL